MSESFPTGVVANGLVEPIMEAAGIEPARHSPRIFACEIDESAGLAELQLEDAHPPEGTVV